MPPDPSPQKALDAATRVLIVCEVIAGIVDAGEHAFLADVRAQWAAEMGLIRIGEAVGKIPAAVREQFPDQPWRQIIDMRNFAAHQYDDLDPHRVWRTLVRDVPALRRYLSDVVIPGLAGDQ
ncbi:DUF86 domain-containing protein [Microbacterium sp.]|uniref:HepT-like ribonuclease domain-containing protein n=1 Tax=Microbacterium sp. TaxID=51671 RepID=UPI0039E69D84